MVVELDEDEAIEVEVTPDADAPDVAEAAGLVYVSDDEPGIIRRRRGKGFSYHRPNGKLVSGRARDRIDELVIPPAWSDVWIARQTDAHLLATGRDDADRKQYMYHPIWRAVRDAQKFERLANFAERLPEVRQASISDVNSRGLTRARVLSAVVSLLDQTLIRVGNERYAADNETFGATTLERQHVTVTRKGAELRFAAKGGIDRVVHVEDPAVAKVIEECLDRRQPQVFCFEEDGKLVDVSSSHVNDWLKSLAGENFTAKDFRTWGGSVVTAGSLGPLGTPTEDADADKQVISAIDAAAERLGNTRAVCRSCYVAPQVPGAHRTGHLDDAWRSSRSGQWMDRAESSTTKVLAA